jgi:GrpB-like predicted nucleotidyltransferase (UPF0157 family)
MEEPARGIEIVPYDPAWPELFAQLGRELRGGLGEVALRIDHIGSTSVPGLAAKPVIDVQVSVAAFEPLEAFKGPLERLGTSTAPATPSAPSATSGSLAAAGEPTSTCGGRAASPSSGRCCSVTSCAPILLRRPTTGR